VCVFRESAPHWLRFLQQCCCCNCNVASATCKSNCQPGCCCSMAMATMAARPTVPHESQKLEADLKLEMPETRRSSSCRCSCRCRRHDVWHLFPASNPFICPSYVGGRLMFLYICATHLACCPIFQISWRGWPPCVGVNCWQLLRFMHSKIGNKRWPKLCLHCCTRKKTLTSNRM